MIISETIKKAILHDVENWGGALNSASWKYIDTYRVVMNDNETSELFNNNKIILREAIIEYINKLEI